MFSRIAFIVVVGAVGLDFGQGTALAQFVPRTVYFNGVVVGGADTAESARLRGMGQYLSGAGQYYQGVGYALQAQSEAAVRQQVAYSLQLENEKTVRETRETMRAVAKQHADSAKRMRTEKNIQQNISRLLSPEDTDDIASGRSLNRLLDQLGSRTVDFPWDNQRLAADDLREIVFQTSHGLSLETLDELLTDASTVRWPAILSVPNLRERCDAIDKAIAAAMKSKNDAQSKAEFDRALKALSLLAPAARTQLSHSSREDWTNGRDFLVRLRGWLTLQRSGQLTQVTVALSHQPQTMSALMQHLHRHQLRFAPTSAPASRTYRILQESLAEAFAKLEPTRLVRGR